MTKNKKKLRRLERRTPGYALRTAQTLVLAGLLVAPALTGSALAADVDLGGNGASWNDPALGTEGAVLNGNSTNKTVALTGAATGAPTTLTITAGNSDDVKLTISSTGVTFSGATTITGDSTAAKNAELVINEAVTLGGPVTLTGTTGQGKAILTINQGKALTATGGVAVGENSSIGLSGTLEGDVTLNGTGAKLASADDAALIKGNVTLTKGELDTSTKNLKIADAAGSGLGNLLLGADSTLTLAASTTLTLGTLTVNKDTDVVGKLEVADIAADSTNKLQLKTNGWVAFKDATGNVVDGVLHTSGDSGLQLAGGGTLTAAKLTILGTGPIAASAAGGATIRIAALELPGDTIFGATDKGEHKMSIDGGAPDTVFLTGGDLILRGASGNTVSLELKGAGGKTDIAERSIVLSGNAAADAQLKVTSGVYNIGEVAGVGNVLVDGTNGGAHLKTTFYGNALNAGYVNITGTSGNIGNLSHRGDLSIAAANLKDNGVTSAGEVGVGQYGVLHVQGALNLTTAADVTSTFTGTVVADTLALSDTTKGYTQATGTLTLLGAEGGGSFLSAAKLTLDGSNVAVNLGDDMAQHATHGGTFAGPVTVTQGTLTVADGTWTLGSLDVAATNGKTSIDGNLIISGETAGSLKSGTAGSAGGAAGLNVTTGGSLQASKAALWDGTSTIASGLAKIWTDAGATLKVAGYETSGITLTDAGKLASAVLAGNGMVSYLGKGITVEAGDYNTETGLTDTLKAASAAGSRALLTGEKVGYDASANGDTPTISTNTGGFGADALVVKTASTATSVTIQQTDDLTLLGGAPNSQLVGIVGGTNVQTNINADGKALTLGSSDTLITQGGVLNGNVALGAATGSLNVVKGQYTVGDITGTKAADITVVGGGRLTAGAVGASSNELNVTLDGSSLLAAKANLNDVDLENGSIIVKNATAADGKLAVVGTLDILKGGMQSSGDMDISSATINTLNGATLIAGGNLNATGKALNAGADGLTISAKELTAASLDGSAGKIVAQATKLTTTGAVDIAKGSILSVTDAGSTIGGVLVMGTAGPDGTSATAVFAKDLTVTANVGVYNGSTLQVGEFKTDTTGHKITVGAADDTKGSSLIIGTLTSNGTAASTFIADPTADNSLIQVKEVGAGGLGDVMIAANNGILSFGEHGMDWTKQQLAAAGSAAKSVLVLSTPVEMAANGQILVGEKWSDDGKWDAAGSASTHGLDVRGSSLVIADISSMDAPGITLEASKNTLNIASSTGLRVVSDTLKGNQNLTLVAGISDTNGVTQDDGGNYVADGEALTLEGGKSTNNLLIGLGDVVYNQGSTSDSGTLSTTTVVNSATAMMPRLSNSMGALLEGMAVDPGFNVHSDNAGVRFVSRALDRGYIGINDVNSAAATIEGAAQMAAVGGVQMSTLGAVNAASNAVSTRTSFAQPLMDMTRAAAVHKSTDGSLSLDSGVSAANGMKNGLGLWIMPLYQSNRSWGMKAENFKSGLNSDLGGIAVGADYTINDMFRFGAAFNIGAGYAQSTGDFNETENRFNFWGVNLYGGWTKNNFGLSADVGYTGNYNKVEQDMPASMQMGNLKADVTSSAWNAGLKAEYKLETSVVDIIPHVGARYLGLTTDEYSVKSGGTVFKVDQDFQSIWTFPVGVALSKTIETDSGWLFKPQVDLSVIPAAGDVKAKSRARIPGVAGDAEMKMQVVDYVTFDGGLGFEVGKDNLSFGLNYNIQASEHRTGHGVFGTLRYEF